MRAAWLAVWVLLLGACRWWSSTDQDRVRRTVRELIGDVAVMKKSYPFTPYRDTLGALSGEASGTPRWG